MSSPAAWHTDPIDSGIMRYWDGTSWVETMTWNGSAWVDTTGAAHTPVPTPAAPPTAAPLASLFEPAAAPASPTSAAPTAATIVAGVNRLAMSTTSWFLFAGCAMAAIATLLPWEQDTTFVGTQVTLGPTSNATLLVFLLVLVGGVFWIGFPSRVRQLSVARCIGLTLVAGLMGIALLLKIAGLANAASSSSSGNASDLLGSSGGLSYGPGIGLYLWGAGLGAIGVAILRGWLRMGFKSAAA